jgi:large subunit ribosomal protein L30
MAEEQTANEASKPAAKKKPAAKNKAASQSGKTIKVTLVRSLINTIGSHRATVRGLGLRRLNHTVELQDTPAVRGMINKVSYLVRWEE